MLSRRIICFWLFIFGSSVWAEYADDESDSSLHFWQAILPYGSEQASQPRPQAFYEVGSFLKTMDGWRRNVETVRQKKPLWVMLRKDLENKDPKEFLSAQVPYFHGDKSGFPSFRFEGRWQEQDQYKFEIVSSADSGGVERKAPPKVFGSFDGKINLQHGTYDALENVLVDIDLSMDFGQMKASEMLASIESFHRLLSFESIEQGGLGDQFESTQEITLDQSDEEVLARLYASAPNVFDTILSISQFENLVDFLHDSEGDTLTLVRHRQKFDLKKLQENFPDTYKDFSLMLKRATFKTEFKTRDGLLFARMGYRAEDKMLFGDVVLKDGGLVLFDEFDRVSDQVIYPTKIEGLEYQVETSLYLELFGLDIAIEGVTFDAHYDAGLVQEKEDRHATISMKMSSLPEVETSGALLYFVPHWLIDLLIPGSIETLVKDSFDDMVNGNHGKGTVLDFHFDEMYTKAGDRHLVSLAAELELPYNTLQTLLKLDKERDDSQDKRLYRTLRKNIRLDYAEKASYKADRRIKSYLERYMPAS